MNWHHFRTILWLRWRLSQNQWRRAGSLASVLSVIAIVLGVVGAVGGFAGALFGGMVGLAHQSPKVVMLVWDAVTAGFLFLWLIGLLAELQRSESIDLQRLMHLPVSLSHVFIINYLASHLSPMIVIGAPIMFGLALGLAFGRGLSLLLLVPLVLSLLFMITAWTYCLRGWLATVMVNQRRRRTIIVFVTMTLVLAGQAPSLYFQLMRKHTPGRPSPTSAEAEKQRRERAAAEGRFFATLAHAHRFLPPLWLANGARALADGQVLPALLGALGGFGLGALGLGRAYRTTVRYYHGETESRPPPEPTLASSGPVLPKNRVTPSRFLEARFPGVPEPATALALATMRSLMRAPEVKMALGMPIIMAFVFGVISLSRTSEKMPPAAKPFLATAAVGFTLFFTFQLFANHFGFDRHGFRALVLLPGDRKFLLLGKNLATLPVGAGLGLLLLGVVSVWVGIPPLAVLAAVFQLVALLALVSIAGNIISIMAPYRIQPGSMKATKMPAKSVILLFVTMLLFPVALVPAFVPPALEALWRLAGWPPAVPVNLLLSLLLASIALAAYWYSLTPLGHLLHRREREILEKVTAEQE